MNKYNINEQKFIRGIGDLANIFPNLDCDVVVPKQTIQERIENAWARVGGAFEKTFEELDNGRKK